MASYQNDTFFIEGDEMPAVDRLTPQAAAKLVARARQQDIANELSRLAAEEYLEDIMEHMHHMEVR